MKETSLAVVTQSMSSLQIAEVTGKQHAHILRDIRNMVEAITKTNESTSGLVGKGYHRGDRTQYKYLSNETQKVLCDFAFGENATQYLITEASYVDAKGESRAMYNLNKKACLLLASGYDVVLRAKIIDRWEELESGKAEPMVKAQAPTQITMSDRLAWVKEVKQLLNLNDASTLGLLQKVGEPLGLPLPDYVPSHGILRSASFLLKENGSPMTVTQFNQLMIQHGLMVELSRPSGYGGVRAYKSIAGDGLYYGENQVCPSFPNGTQPLYYAHRFHELLGILIGKGGVR